MMKAGDGAILMIPLLRRIAEASFPVAIGDLANDPHLLQLAAENQRHFENSLRWAAAYLEKECLLVDTGEGRYAATMAGIQQVRHLNGEAGPSGRDLVSRTIARMEHEVRTELLARLYAMPPAFFETAVIDLLVAMKYGDTRDSIAYHVGRSGDGGIDGAIPRDELGLDVIYVQAKRYRPAAAVPVNDVRDFSGSLEQHRATTGVFATTATFSRPAREFASRISRRIRLIDGGEFVSLMFKHKIGVKDVETWSIREIDSSYFVRPLVEFREIEQISSASIQPRR